MKRRSWKTFLVLGGTLLILNCHRAAPATNGPVSARSLAEAYDRSSAAVRSQYDGKEITVRGYAELAAVMPSSESEEGSVLLVDKEVKPAKRVVCWFSKEQSETFSKIKGEQYVTVRGVFNGEAGADLKFCKLVNVE